MSIGIYHGVMSFNRSALGFMNNPIMEKNVSGLSGLTDEIFIKELTTAKTSAIIYEQIKKHKLISAISSVGQSHRLITGWSGVRVPDGAPTYANKKDIRPEKPDFIGLFHVSGGCPRAYKNVDVKRLFYRFSGK